MWEIQLETAPNTVAWGRDWLREESMAAWAMGFHKRLGESSHLIQVDEYVLGIIAHLVDGGEMY